MCVRIQRKRTAGWKTPANTKYVGRPTKWGNPFTIKCVNGKYTINSEKENLWTIMGEYCKEGYDTKAEALSDILYCYEVYVRNYLLKYLDELYDKNLSCFCNLELPCHVDIIFKLIKEFKQD